MKALGPVSAEVKGGWWGLVSAEVMRRAMGPNECRGRRSLGSAEVMKGQWAVVMIGQWGQECRGP